MKPRSPRTKAPKRRDRTDRQKPPASKAPPAEAAPASGTSYETNVAPDLIDESRPPDRADAPESECSLPAKNGAGVPD